MEVRLAEPDPSAKRLSWGGAACGPLQRGQIHARMCWKGCLCREVEQSEAGMKLWENHGGTGPGQEVTHGHLALGDSWVLAQMSPISALSPYG